MGGLGGLPFVGKVGFGAYSHHVPDNGNLFILFAPHVGLSPDGIVGKFHRVGQTHIDSACGAAIGAFNTLQKHSKGDGTFDEKALLSAASPLDMQFAYIIEKMKPKYDKIAAHPNPQTGTAIAMFELARDFILEIVGPIHGGKVILCGGIQINMAKPCEDYFETHFFKVYKDGKEEQDLMHFIKADLKYKD